ncbi:hypothetical protein K470DRAFT_262137 [Piedraia hortae CBS 480.64]|uniref:BHLH domain-containing protein n=1 Tax=Piedraia hortae CBS 480.64 TaxID=1314780 RepID=A0A6A7C8S9_9PEZI|nr:hypothetical protein K470DRAFT_262137 [Piedraia hortae CBS 480.64]
MDTSCWTWSQGKHLADGLGGLTDWPGLEGTDLDYLCLDEESTLPPCELDTPELSKPPKDVGHGLDASIAYLDLKSKSQDGARPSEYFDNDHMPPTPLGHDALIHAATMFPSASGTVQPGALEQESGLTSPLESATETPQLPTTSPMFDLTNDPYFSIPDPFSPSILNDSPWDQPNHATEHALTTSSNAISPIDLNVGDGKQDCLQRQGSKERLQPTAKTAPKRKSNTLIDSVPAEGESDALISLGPPALTSGSTENLHGEAAPEAARPLMGPPPRPSPVLTGSTVISPSLQHHQHGGLAAAATPRSFLANSNTSHPVSSLAVTPIGNPLEIDDFRLPEPATNSNIISASPGSLSNELSDGLVSRKTPKLGPQSTPCSSSIPGSPLPAASPWAQPKEQKETKSGRSKKRNSGASPAIRARISPNIKPNLPQGSNASTQALLASKSNYQNIVEGNHVPGVNYPDALSVGLTSKRASHKLAEQGRRDRMNEALREMQALLPKAVADSPNLGGPDGAADGETRSSSSKAATIEQANVYIRKLQANELLLQQKLERLRKERGPGE